MVWRSMSLAGSRAMARSSTTFKPGQSGCPGGRPKSVAEVRELARKYTVEAIETLVEIMRDAQCTPAVRVAAANALLDRGHGRPPQAIETSNGTTLVVMTGIGRAPDQPLLITDVTDVPDETGDADAVH